MNTHFNVTFAYLEGKRTLILDYRGPDGRSLFLPVTEIHPVRTDGLMAVCYDYQKPTDTRPFGIVHLVLGPGVSVSTEGWPEEWQPSLEYPDLRIIRVQNAAVIPPIGAEIRPSFLLSRYEEGSLGNGSRNLAFHVPLSPPLAYAQITPFPEGVEIYHPASYSVLTMRVAKWSRKPEEAKDGHQRFAYRHHEDVTLASPASPIFTLLTTSEVEIELRDTRTNRTPHNVELEGLRSVYQLWAAEFERIDDTVDPSKERGFKPVDQLVPYSNEGVVFATMMVDVAIGAIPIVGDAVDIGEFLYAFHSGKDKWGFDVNALELTLMGILALVPFLSSGLAKSTKFSRVFGRLSNRTPLLARALQDAGLSEDEWKAIARASELLSSGARPSPGLQETLATALRKLEGRSYRTLDEITGPGDSFNHALIQRYYEAAQRKRVSEGALPVPPEVWIKGTRGRARALLQSTLGPEFDKVTRLKDGGHRIRTGNIPKPVHSRLRVVEDQVTVLLQNRMRLLERLGNSIKEGLPAATRGSREIKAAHFRILKGNVAEILSRDHQLEYLDKALETRPDAMLVEGVFARTIGENGALSKEKLFSDNLIIRFGPRGQLEVLGVIEVKSGYAGRYAAQLQIFEWIEGRIEDGTQIVLPAGARMTGKGGAVSRLPAKRTFTYNPPNPDTPRVISLQRARRHLIVAREKSLLGFDSQYGVAAEVKPAELEYTSQELDYIVGRIAEELTLGTPY
jgi:hypothetical protein